MSSNEASSEVTYTSISIDLYEDAALQAPPSPDYVTGPEEHEQAPPLSDYVPGPEYPEYLAPSDTEILVESEDGPTDYPADGRDDDNDDSFGDHADLEDEEEVSREDEEEEHLAPIDSTAIPLAIELVPSAEVTEPFETDESRATPPPPPAYHNTSRISVRSQVPIPFPSEAKVDRFLALPTPPPSLLTPLSSLLSQIPLLPTSPTYAQAPLGYRATGLRAASPPTDKRQTRVVIIYSISRQI
ncbi:hypothetical protein Tco_1251863 [Tanacetum coccineum]